MWWPRTTDELRAAFASGDLIESQSLDLKRELPGKNKSLDLAIDACAMTPDGGVLIYGVSDSDGVADELLPFPLGDQRDRVYRIVRSGVSEAPQLEVVELVNADAEGGRRGFLVLVVPASARAPHMVTVKGERRYYGRNGTENVPLSEGEVARLYDRRERLTVDLNVQLNAVIAESTLAQHPDFARLFFYAAPTLAEDDLLERARAATAAPGREREPAILSEHLRRAQIATPARGYAPNTSALAGWKPTSRGFCMSTAADQGADLSATDPDSALKLEVTHSGVVIVECGRAAYGSRSSGGHHFIFEELIAGLVVQGLAYAGSLYDAAGYTGAVDMGVAVCGIKDGVSMERFGPGPHPIERPVPYDRDEYRRVQRGSALALARDPHALAGAIVTPLIRTTIGAGHETILDRFRP